MKNMHIFWMYFSISLFSIPALAQIMAQNHNAIIKTNVLIIKEAQQWSLSLESKSSKPKQTNNYTIGYNKLLSGESSRTGAYVSYARRFYTSPVFNHLHFFISPQGKIIYRNVDEENIWFIRLPSFKSVSIAPGGNLGVQSILFKRMSIEYLMGIGLGAVLWQEDYGVKAFPIHIDAQIMIQLGYKF